jgi:polyisoprenoid-binding protein YceI
MTGTITSNVGTMETGNGPRDSHLLGPQWLDAKKYPQIKFDIASITNLKVDGNAATGYATGTFTMHGVSKIILIPFSLRYITENGKTRERAPGDMVMFAAEFDIALKDFNVLGTDGLVGSKVGEKIHIKAQLFANTAPASTNQ